ncbi:MAG: hypothetical protein KDD64_08875 [Bdellovibrionales bacterium]|nr:hypothetical protein [Bdellovibrionales bacterium]
MPYILSGMIRSEMPGLWGEGSAYSRESVYRLSDTGGPPVNYDRHTLGPHSIPHVDAPLHILHEGESVSECMNSAKWSHSFFGPTLVVRLQGDRFSDFEGGGNTKLWRINREELQEGILRASGCDRVPEKLILTADAAPVDEWGFCDPNYVLVLDEEAAEFLVSSPAFNAYGTSWKSTDFQPGSRERPIHKILFRQALLFEYLKLVDVPEGEYFLSAFPLFLENASESPLTPVLFSRGEIDWEEGET